MEPLTTVELLPATPPAHLRVTGPGRREREYRTRIADLYQDLGTARTELAESHRSLEVAQLVERGTSRLLDRLENDLAARADEIERIRQQGHRLLVTLGALQRENAGLRAELDRLRDLPALPEPRRRRRWGRLLGRA